MLCVCVSLLLFFYFPQEERQAGSNGLCYFLVPPLLQVKERRGSLGTSLEKRKKILTVVGIKLKEQFYTFLLLYLISFFFSSSFFRKRPAIFLNCGIKSPRNFQILPLMIHGGSYDFYFTESATSSYHCSDGCVFCAWFIVLFFIAPLREFVWIAFISEDLPLRAPFLNKNKQDGAPQNYSPPMSEYFFSTLNFKEEINFVNKIRKTTLVRRVDPAPTRTCT